LNVSFAAGERRPLRIIDGLQRVDSASSIRCRQWLQSVDSVEKLENAPLHFLAKLNRDRQFAV